MKTLWLFWLREYRRMLSDKGVLIIFFGAILIYPFFYPLAYEPEVIKEMPVAVMDEDHSTLSRRLIRMIDAGETISVVSRPSNLAVARDEFFYRKIYGIVVIPRGFQQDLLRQRQPVVSLYADASYFMLYNQFTSGATQAVRTMSAGVSIQRLQARGQSWTQAVAAADPLRAVAYPLFNPAGGYATLVVPAVLIMLLQQTLLLGIGMLGEEEVDGFSGEDRISPEATSPFPEILGKGGAYFSVYLMHGIYLFGVLPRIYHFPEHGNPLHLMLFIIPFLLAAIFMGITFAHFFSSREAAMITLASLSIPFLFLSGFSWPTESMPWLLRGLAIFLPTTCGISGALRIQGMGATLGQVAPEWMSLWVLSGFYLLTAFAALKYMHEKR